MAFHYPDCSPLGLCIEFVSDMETASRLTELDVFI